jgi:multisubunit Na+/H+ antiporter MnhF subunit
MTMKETYRFLYSSELIDHILQIDTIVIDYVIMISINITFDRRYSLSRSNDYLVYVRRNL